MTDFTSKIVRARNAEKSHLHCHYCGLSHDRVEAGGLWHCPNKLCPGPGASYWRHHLSTCRQTADGRHTVDPQEWLDKSVAAAWDELDEVIRQSIFDSAERMRKELAEDE